MKDIYFDIKELFACLETCMGLLWKLMWQRRTALKKRRRQIIRLRRIKKPLKHNAMTNVSIWATMLWRKYFSLYFATEVSPVGFVWVILFHAKDLLHFNFVTSRLLNEDRDEIIFSTINNTVYCKMLFYNTQTTKYIYRINQ